MSQCNINEPLSRLESDILCGAVNDLAEYQRMGEAYYWPDARDTRGLNIRIAIMDAADGLVRCQPSEWVANYVGAPSQRMAISRAYAALQERGLVRLVAAGFSPKRVSHLRPTEAGRAMAATLLTEAATDA